LLSLFLPDHASIMARVERRDDGQACMALSHVTDQSRSTISLPVMLVGSGKPEGDVENGILPA